MSLDRAFELLDWLLSIHPVDALSLYDEMSFSDRDYALEFCRRIKPYNLRWKCFIHASLVTEEILAAMKETGCAVAVMGIESADENVLRSMQKNIKIKRVEEILEFAAKIDLLVVGGLIFGDMEESMETAWASINWRESQRKFFAGKNIVSMSRISIFPGSYLYRVACEKGIIKDRVQFLKDICPPVNVSKMSEEEFHVTLSALLHIYGPPNKLNEAKIVSRSGCSVSVVGYCPWCSNTVDYENLPLVLASPQTCPHCNNAIAVNPIELCDFVKLNTNTEALVNGKNAAVWAITFHNLYWIQNHIPALKADNVRFVNSNRVFAPYIGFVGAPLIKTIAGNEVYTPDNINPNRVVTFTDDGDNINLPVAYLIETLGGKKIFTPSVIASEGIDTIIVPNSPEVFQSIKEQCAAEFPSVKQIVHITELL